jgi:hypothetical protein
VFVVVVVVVDFVINSVWNLWIHPHKFCERSNMGFLSSISSGVLPASYQMGAKDSLVRGRVTEHDADI